MRESRNFLVGGVGMEEDLKRQDAKAAKEDGLWLD